MSTLEEALVAPAEAQTFAVTDEQSAEWAMRKLAQKRREMTDNDALADAEIQRIHAWLEEVNTPLQADADYFEGLLTGWHQQQDPERKTIKLPAGTLKARKAPDRIEVADDFTDWAIKSERPELVRTTFAPNKAAIKEAALKDGEVLPGVEVITGEVRYTIEVSE